MRFLFALLLGATALVSSCGEDSQGPPDSRGVATPRIPVKYENWNVTYSTGENKILSRRLVPEDASILVRGKGNLDTAMRIDPLASMRFLAYEREVAGETEVVVLSLEDGIEKVLTRGHLRQLGVRDDRQVLFVESKDESTSELWSYDVETGKKKLVASEPCILPVMSQEATNTQYFVTARSEPPAEPTDHKLYGFQGDMPVMLMPTVEGRAFEHAVRRGDDLLVMLLQTPGDVNGRVVLEGPEERILAEEARIEDVSAAGGILLIEPTQTDPDDIPENAGGDLHHLKYIDPTTLEAREVGPERFYSLGRICGDRVLATSYLDGEHQLDRFDLKSGETKNLFHSPNVRISQLRVVDDEAVLCVLDTIGPDGIVQESVLNFVPVDGSPMIELDRTVSGFIHVGSIGYCTS